MPIDDATVSALAQRLRRDSLIATSEAGSGHPTSCMSAAEIVASLFAREMSIDPRDPSRAGTDHFVLSKGHAAPILWAVLKEIGAISIDLNTLRRFDSPLEGHPIPATMPGWVKVATGSLGQGICAAVGMALGRRVAGDPGRIYCLLGDGEIAEGSVWEAAELAAYDKLANLCAIVDVNGLGQSGRTMHGHDIDAIAGKWRAFGWNAIGLDGHDVAALARGFDDARKATDRPSVILARTLKGKGAKLVEGKPGWHGKPLKKGAELDGALADVGDPPLHLTVAARTRGQAGARPHAPQSTPAAPTYKLGDQVAPREAWGDALVRIGTIDARIVVLDAEVKNSTFSEKFKDKFPQRFAECFIAEQNMVGVALGLAAEGFVPCASTFGAFFTRAYDFIRMAACSTPPHLILCGTHVGVSIGEDGPSQMALEDLAMMRALIGTTVLYPSDGMSTSRLVEEAVNTSGIVYIRAGRPKNKILYGPDEKFPVGGSKVLRSSPDDKVTIAAAGVTVYEALSAHDRLAREGIATRVIDVYSVKPLDEATLGRAVAETKGLVTVEDHTAWGGLGEAIAAAVRPRNHELLAVRELPRSGKPEELLAHHKIDADAIVSAVRRIVSTPSGP
jgi:transketolase